MSAEVSIHEKWSTLLSEWNSIDDRPIAIETAYSNPIPENVRSRAWFIMSGARDLMRKNIGVYLELTTKGKASVVDSIEKDLCRTFSSKQDNDHFHDPLLRILTAYSNFNQWGYSQGINYITAFILKQFTRTSPMDPIDELVALQLEESKESESAVSGNGMINDIEEECFWTLVAVMTEIDTLFNNDLVGFHEAVHCLQKVMEYHGPKELVDHLEADHVYNTICTKWYHALFTLPTMNSIMAYRIWDIWIAERMDFAVVLKVSYLILIRHCKQLLMMDFMEMTNFCQSTEIWKFDGKYDHDLIQRTATLQLNELYLKPIRRLKYVKKSKGNKDNDVDEDNEDDNNESSVLEVLWSYIRWGF